MTRGGYTIATVTEDGEGNVDAISIGNIGYVRNPEADVKYGDTVPSDHVPGDTDPDSSDEEQGNADSDSDSDSDTDTDTDTDVQQ